MSEQRTLFRPASESRPPGPQGEAYPTYGAMSAGEDEERASLLETMGFAFRAALRRPTIALATLGTGLVLTVVASRLAPRAYEADARMLVARTSLPSTIAAQTQNAGYAPDENKRDAKEFEHQIFARQNLEAIARDAKLVERWNEIRPSHRRVLDELGGLLGGGAMSDDQKLDALVRTMEKNIKLTMDTSAVNVQVEWSDPFVARDIAAQVIKKFQESRYAVEVGVIPEAIAVLEGHFKEARESVVAAATEAQEEKARKPVAVGTPRPARASGVKRDPVLEARIADVQRRIQDERDTRRGQLGQLNNRLAELSGTYGPAHPAIVALKTQIESTQRDSPELAALRQQESELQARRNASSEGGGGGNTPAAPRAASAEMQAAFAGDAPIPGSEYATSQDRFEAAERRYEALRARIETANIEKQLAEATFKHKYSVVKPADLPLQPKKPTGLLVFLGGTLASLLLALGAAYGADLFSGVLYEKRRVRDTLRLPLLGETDVLKS